MPCSFEVGFVIGEGGRGWRGFGEGPVAAHRRIWRRATAARDRLSPVTRYVFDLVSVMHVHARY